MNHVERSNLSLFPNPFLAPSAREPFAAQAIDRRSEVEAEEPASPADEAVEIKVLWGGECVQVATVSRGRAFTLGDDGCDFALPRETVGARALPLVAERDGGFVLTLPVDGAIEVREESGAIANLDALLARGVAAPSAKLAGRTEVILPSGATARVLVPSANVAFVVSPARATKRFRTGLLAALDREVHAYTGMSAFMHAAVIAAFAFFLPGMKGTDGEDIDRDQVDAMKPYLASIAERETEERVQEETGDKERAGGTGTAAQGEAGQLGSPTAKVQQTRYAVKGSADNTDPHIARERALHEAETFGMLSILQGSTENAPVAAWARPDASGKDPKSALGGMWGSSIDDAFGANGLALAGVGEGGGGFGEGIGLGGIGGLGHGLGDGDGQSIGGGDGRWGKGHASLPGTYKPKGISMRTEPVTSFGGRIPAEVIQRIVRQNFGRFRVCYENGLRQNPGLTGRVAVRFVIDRDGGVSLASDGGSDLPDQAVIGCVVRGFQGLSFPEPQGGTVKVTYPLVFSPGE